MQLNRKFKKPQRHRYCKFTENLVSTTSLSCTIAPTYEEEYGNF